MPCIIIAIVPVQYIWQIDCSISEQEVTRVEREKFALQ